LNATHDAVGAQSSAVSIDRGGDSTSPALAPALETTVTPFPEASLAQAVFERRLPAKLLSSLRDDEAQPANGTVTVRLLSGSPVAGDCALLQLELSENVVDESSELSSVPVR